MTDPQLTIGEIVPGWFTPVFLGIVVVGSITNNALVSYSAGLSAQGIGVRVHRVTTVIVTGLIATLASFWLAFMSPGFLETMEYALELTVTILGPLIAIYAVDILLRRNNYNGLALNDERRGSPFWYSHGVFWPGVSAQVIGTVIAIMMSNTTLYRAHCGSHGRRRPFRNPWARHWRCHLRLAVVHHETIQEPPTASRRGARHPNDGRNRRPPTTPWR